MIIELPGNGYNGYSQIFIKFPDSVFVKTEAMLGIDIGALFVDKKKFGAYAPRENELYYGEIELLDLRDFLQIELETDELLEVLTGLIQVVVDSSSTLQINDGKFLITTRKYHGKIKYWIDARKYVVTRSQLLNAQGQVVQTKKFRRFRKNKGVVLPQNIWLTRPLAKEQITVYYTRQKINHSISSKKFKLKVADNARRIYWGDVKRPQIERKPN